MHVGIHTHGFSLTPGLRVYVEKRLAYALTHGGDNKRCLIEARLKQAPRRGDRGCRGRSLRGHRPLRRTRRADAGATTGIRASHDGCAGSRFAAMPNKLIALAAERLRTGRVVAS